MKRLFHHSAESSTSEQEAEGTVGRGDLSDGEVYFLYWLIRGSIMFTGTRVALRRTWGMCERHSFGFLSVDAEFRRSSMTT